MSRQRDDWDEMGRVDALWAILSAPDKRHGNWDLGEFMATGAQEIDAVLASARPWGLPVAHARALDFGCGVGRLTRALAAHFSVVEGVDISGEMVNQARTVNAETPACSFAVLGDDGLEAYPDRSFDFIYSRIVLQHIPDRSVIERNLRDFVRLLAEDGLLVFQLPSHIPLRRRLQLRPRLYLMLRRLALPNDVLYERFGLHPIRMNAVPEQTVLGLLASSGATTLRVDKSFIGDTGVADRVYYATVGGRVRG